MTQLPVPVYERDVEEMFQVVDTDRDGRISYQEFCVSFVEIHRVKEGLEKEKKCFSYYSILFFLILFSFPLTKGENFLCISKKKRRKVLSDQIVEN